MSKRLEVIAGTATVGSAVIAGLIYGVTDAKGGGMPGKEYVIPLLAVSGFCFGAKPSRPTDKLDPKVGGVYAGIATVVYGAFYGLGYAVEKLTS